MAEQITASEALSHFQNSLGGESRDDVPAVARFTAWFGEERSLDALTAEDIARYVHEHTDGSRGQTEPLRAFLAYASRLAFTDGDLVSALQVGGKPAPKATAAGSKRRVTTPQLDPGATAYQVTLDGLRRLEQQLEEEKAKRPEIAQKLHDAMADKDFRENAPLDAARDEQAHLEARIRDLEAKLRNAVIIDEDAKRGRANVGSVVKVLNVGAGREQTFTLVSPTEMDPAGGKISIASPVGVALANHSAGDEVTVNAPAGPITFRLLDVQG